jgi:hypothetical protein
MDKKTTNLSEKQSFPLKKIESLIKLANTYDLALLQVGSIRIVPGNAVRPQNAIPEVGKGSPKKELTRRQMEDTVLFGSPMQDEE